MLASEVLDKMTVYEMQAWVAYNRVKADVIKKGMKKNGGR